MTSPLGGFLEGEHGRITYPVPVFVIEHPQRLIVVDTGLHPELATDTSRLGALASTFDVHLPSDNSASVGHVLRGAGFDPNDVDDVVLTHLHFDHAGGVAQLPNARLVVQRREWESRHDERLVLLGAYQPDDFDLGHDLLEVDGDHDLLDDGTVTLLLTDGHTAGHQSVMVRTEEGRFVLCGDCCYLHRTLRNEHLPPFGTDRTRQLAAIRRMKNLQQTGATLIYGHDPDQWSTITEHGLRPGV